MQLLVDTTLKLHASEKRIQTLTRELTERNEQLVEINNRLHTSEVQISILEENLSSKVGTTVRIAFNFDFCDACPRFFRLKVLLSEPPS